MENATLVDIVKEQNPNGGLPSEVWNRFVKANGSKIGRKAVSHDAMIYNALVKWYGSGRSLYDLKDEDAAKYVEFLTKNTSANSVWRVSLPTLTEIWAKSLPLCGNPWSKFKWDSMRENVVPETPTPSKIDAKTGLEEFAEKFFASEASSGKKIERNALGFVRHLMKHMGVRTIGDVTRKVAYDYAVKLRDDPECVVVRGGADRITKLAAMWDALLPDAENPFKGVTYADAIRIAKYNAMIETKSDLSPTECLRAVPTVLWSQYIQKRPKIGVNRTRTVKSIFFRFWKQSGLERPIQVTSEVAAKYTADTINSKATGIDDIRELRAVWDLLMPNIVNPWENALKPLRKKTGRKGAELDVESTEKPTEEPHAEEVQTVEAPKAEEAAQTKADETSAEKSYSFEELFSNWKKTLRRDYDPKTYEQYQRVLAYFMDYARERGIMSVSKDTVTIEMAKEFRNIMAKKVKLVRNVISPLKTIWTANFGINNPWRTITAGMEVVYVLKDEQNEPEPRQSFWTRLMKFLGFKR